MITETRKAFALAALIVAAGVATVELTRSPAQAESMTPGDYAAARIEAAFEVVAAMPPVPAVRVPLVQKGDLEVPTGCEGAAEAECMDVAYEVPSEPSLVVETRSGTTSTLLRMDAMTVASGAKEPVRQSE
jgi:hypothetical protein